MPHQNNSIAPALEDALTSTFDHINFLISNEALDEAKEQLAKLHPADLADFLDNINYKEYAILIPAIAELIDHETIIELRESSKQPILEILGAQYSKKLIEMMDIDDAIDVFGALSDEFKSQLIDLLDGKLKQYILEGFNYPENTVGRILERDYITLSTNWSVDQAIKHIKKIADKDDFYAAITVDSRSRPTGTILASKLLQSEGDELLNNLINKDFKILDAYAEIEDAVYNFKQYSLTIIPVVNKVGKLIGAVSIDNMLYIIDEQTESEFLQLGGVATSDIFENLLETSKHRLPWLCVNLITACSTALIIDMFSSTIVKLVTLATITPIVAALSGNVGTQVMTVTVRALANREINTSNASKIILKEMIVNSLNGVIISILGMLVTYILFSKVSISIVFATSILINFLMAGLLGAGIPILMHKKDFDPATASGVFVQAGTDAVAFFSFLGLAYLFLV